MKRSFSAIALFLALHCGGQDALVHTYGGGGTEEFRAVVVMPDSGFALVGSTGSMPDMATDIYVVRTDSLLGCEWSLALGSAGVDTGRDIVLDEEGNLYVCGYRADTESGYDGVVYKISDEGEVIWEIALGSEAWDFAHAIDLDNEGMVWMGGSTYAGGVRKPWLLTFSAEGMNSGQWILASSGAGEVTDLVCTPSGILVCGWVETEEGIRRSAVWRLDQEGSVMWNRLDGEPGWNRQANGIAVNDEFIYVCGTQDTPTFTQGYSQRLDYSGAQHLISQEMQPDVNEYTAIVPVGGSFYSIGRTRAYGFGNYDGHVFRFTDSGGFEGGLFYGTGEEDSFIGGARVPGGFVACGSRQTVEGQYQAVVMRYTRPLLFSEDIMMPEEETCLPVSIPEIQEELRPFGPYRVYDISARLLQEGEARDLAEVKASLGSGFYLVVFRTGWSVRLVIP